MSKQATLFETWADENNSSKTAEWDKVKATDEFDSLFQAVTVPHDLPESLPNTTVGDDAPRFDESAGKIWIYPTNYPVRDYQFNIVQKCLFKNTLVCLPTGLGKTFIAAVVMFNFYRWYPNGKIVFLAPTKPLVAQQIEACYGITGIPQEHLVEMTGSVQPYARLELWNSRRVFFLTPQVLQNDLGHGSCPARHVCCIVFDEAHKALGNHAYCQVIKELTNARGQYRVLALSATPGNDLRGVQQVLTNLQISHVELRSEDSFDIQKYVHSRKIEKIVVPLEGPIWEVKDSFLKVLSNVVKRLAKMGLLFSSDPERLGKYHILQARDKCRHNPPPSISSAQAGAIESDFALLISLYHAYELLLQHGLRSFYHFLSHTLSGGQSRAKLELSRSVDFKVIMDRLEEQLSVPNCEDFTACREDTPFFYSHPKLLKLEEVVLEHFRTASNSETRIMIFSQYRESVQEITDMLVRHAPLVRVMSFVGHANSGKMNRGLSHKEQTKVIQRFRAGGYNALVSTCVGEEGLDIGEVDLIICFDAHKSPVRLVQRMGRTGRKRSGRIVVIVAEGKEEQIYMKSQSNKSNLHRAIMEGCRSLQMYPSSCVMVPRHIVPQVCMMHLSTVIGSSDRMCTSLAIRCKSNSGTFAGDTVQSCHLGGSSSGFLSECELKDWTKSFSLPDQEGALIEASVNIVFQRDCHATLKALGSVLCVGSRQQLGRTLSLSSCAHWQTAPIPFHIIGHSRRSAQLMSVLNFIDHIHSTNGVGLNYEMEMKAFLNVDDIKPLNDENKTCRKRMRVFHDSSDDEDFQRQLKHGDQEQNDCKSETCQAWLLPSQLTTRGITSLMNPSDNDKPVLIPEAPVLGSLDWLNDYDPSQQVTPIRTSQADYSNQKTTETGSKVFSLSVAPALSKDTSSRCLEGLSSKTLFDDIVMDSSSESGENQLIPDANVTVVPESDLDDEHTDSNIADVSLLNPKDEKPSTSVEDSFLLVHGNRDQRPYNPLKTPPPMYPAKRRNIDHPEQVFGVEITEFLEEEAEVSGSEDPSSETMEEGLSDDEYEKSFINDNTILTQYPSADCYINKDAHLLLPRMKSTSPTGPYRNRYRMVLSQRHTILGCLMKKGIETSPVILENDEQEDFVNDSKSLYIVDDIDEKSKAEERFLEYGEEGAKESICTQQLLQGSKNLQEQLPETVEGLLPSSCRATVVSPTTGELCSDGAKCKGDVIDSSLMASIQFAPTPLYLAIGMEDWIRDDRDVPGSKQIENDRALTDRPLKSLQPKRMIFVNSHTVANSQIVSILRHKYGLCVNLLALPHGGIIVSNTMLVERRLQSELNKASHFITLISSLLDMLQMYSPISVILERDGLREGKRPKFGTQYENMLARLIGMKINILFSQSQEHTASLLDVMVAMEIERGQGILIPADVVKASHQVLQLLLQIPKLSYIAALNICVQYRTVADIMQSSPQELMEKVPSMTVSSAKAIYQFFNHTYNSGLVS